jgi:hypothetical protein
MLNRLLNRLANLGAKYRVVEIGGFFYPQTRRFLLFYVGYVEEAGWCEWSVCKGTLGGAWDYIDAIIEDERQRNRKLPVTIHYQ